MRDPNTLAEQFRRLATDAASKPATHSPLHEGVALALAAAPEALLAITSRSGRRAHPLAVLAALHDMALAGRAPRLEAAYERRDIKAAQGAAIELTTHRTDEVMAAAARRPVRADEASRGAVLHPAITEAARRASAEAVGLIDVGCSAGLNLIVDRIGIRYGSTGNGAPLAGNPSSPVQYVVEPRGRRPIPTRPLPPVVARIGIDAEPIDATDTDDARWLHACLPPDQPERAAQLDAELALLASEPRTLLSGDALDLLAAAIDCVPDGALPVVTTTWTLSSLTPQRRLRFVQCLGEVAAQRPLAWVSVEGVGVAPVIPTMGDRRASGHSIVGIALMEHRRLRAEAVGRCWLRGRMMSWLPEERQPQV